jgi:hypothetical protein
MIGNHLKIRSGEELDIWLVTAAVKDGASKTGGTTPEYFPSLLLTGGLTLKKGHIHDD